MPKIILTQMAVKYFLFFSLLVIATLGCAERPQVTESSFRMVTVHSKEMQSCISCHEADRPVGPVGLSKFNHIAVGAVGDCMSCHATVPENIGKTWKIE